jgi:hypothetical protein
VLFLTMLVTPVAALLVATTVWRVTTAERPEGKREPERRSKRTDPEEDCVVRDPGRPTSNSDSDIDAVESATNGSNCRRNTGQNR